MKIGKEENSGGPMRIFSGQSMKSYDDAIKAAVTAATEELPGISFDWFEVIEFRGGFHQNKPQFQTAIRIGYGLGST